MNVELLLPQMQHIPHDVGALLKIDFTSYKSWDLITLTQNYLRLLLFHLRSAEEAKDGM